MEQVIVNASYMRDQILVHSSIFKLNCFLIKCKNIDLTKTSLFIWDELFYEVNQSQKCSTFCSSDYIIVQFFLLRTTFKVVAIGKRSQLFLGRFCAEHRLRGSVMPAGGTWWSLLGRLDELLLAVCGNVKKPPGRSGIQLCLVSAKHPDIGHPHNLTGM